MSSLAETSRQAAGHPSHLTTKLVKVRKLHAAEPEKDNDNGDYRTSPCYSLEFFPPKTTQGLENLYARIARMSKPSQSPVFPVKSRDGHRPTITEPSWLQVTWGAGGSTDRWSIEMARRIQAGDLPFPSSSKSRPQLSEGSPFDGDPTHTPAEPANEFESQNPNSVDALLHLTCTNVTLESLRNTLKTARSAGVRNILALRGDPPRGQEYWVAADSRFQHATDLVRFIREEHGDFFCVGVAGYPEGHPDDALLAHSLGGEEHSEGGPGQNEGSSTDPIARDIQNLLKKQAAGAQFVITQLFYDVDAFLSWERRAYAAGVTIPIIPGVMPIINYQSFRRMTSLCRIQVPERIFADLQAIKIDDAQVRAYGVDLAKRMIRTIWADPQSRVKAFHLCTLNLEKSVSRIVAEIEWWCSTQPSAEEEKEGVRIRNRKIQSDEERATESAMSHLSISPEEATRASLSALRSSNKAQALVASSGLSGTAGGDGQASSAENLEKGDFNQSFNAPPLLAPKSPSLRVKNLLSDTAATWDEFPNGRFGDIRSPAYGEIDGYGASLKMPPMEAMQKWGRPVNLEDISKIFVRYLCGQLDVIPWCDVPLMEETDSIRDALLRLNASPAGTAVHMKTDQASSDISGKAWWTVGSQPAVDGVPSADETFGFGPRGGYVYQKAFVEFFVSKEDKESLQARIEQENKRIGGGGNISFFAGNGEGDFETNMDSGKSNAVTWAIFPGQEIVQPTIIEEESFKAWCQEAFAIWAEWESLFPPNSKSGQLLSQIRQERWLMTIVHHDFKDQDALWRFLQ